MGSMDSMMDGADLKRRLIVSVVLAIPVILLSPMMGIELPFQLTFAGSDWVVAALATILFFYGGKPFFVGAAGELKSRRPAMMTLVSLGISTAYFYSMYAFAANTFFPGPERVMDFFWELATLVVIMLLGHWIEMKAVMGAGDALEKMAELLPSKASVQQPDGSYIDVDLSHLAVGQTVMVRAGEKMPADGTIVEGQTTVNESMVTGEARDVRKHAGDTVIGGSQNGSGSVLVRVTGTGESGYLAQVMDLVGSAQKEKSRAETLADKVARWLFFAAVGAGIAALIVWFAVTRDVGLAVTRTVTVLVIACPHALGLAIPLVTARSTSLGAENGLLVRRRNAYETARKATVIMMDKTGTLTEGDFKVTDVVSFDAAHSVDEALAVMAGLEAGSSHPLAASIVREAHARSLDPANVIGIQTIAGVGVEGLLDGKSTAKIVAARSLDARTRAPYQDRINALAAGGQTVSCLVLEGRLVGAVAQGDRIRADAKKTLDALKKRGIKPIMLTGDSEAVAKSVAEALGIDEYHASLMPQDKECVVAAHQRAGDVVIMVGDGINDAPSLARADVGVAIGAGTDVAIDSADVVLVKSDPGDILRFLDLARNTSRKTVQNLWWGAGYNVVAIPLAAGVLAPIGILLSPAVGAVLMSLSTVIVAVNALTLKVDR